MGSLFKYLRAPCFSPLFKYYSTSVISYTISQHLPLIFRSENYLRYPTIHVIQHKIIELKGDLNLDLLADQKHVSAQYALNKASKMYITSP